MSLAQAAHTSSQAQKETAIWSVARRIRRRLYADNFGSSKRAALGDTTLGPEAREVSKQAS